MYKCVIKDLVTLEKLYRELILSHEQMKKLDSILEAYELIYLSPYANRGDVETTRMATYDEIMRLEFEKSDVMDNAQYFSICLLIDESKNVWINLRNNPEKDFYLHYQVTGGRREIYENGEMETSEDCMIRETKEETNIVLSTKDLNEICEHQYFSDFKNENGRKKLYVCKIFFACIHNQKPQQMEPDKNGEWMLVTLKELETYKLTYSLEFYLDFIKKKITSKRIIKKITKHGDENVKENS